MLCLAFPSLSSIIFAFVFVFTFVSCPSYSRSEPKQRPTRGLSYGLPNSHVIACTGAGLPVTTHTEFREVNNSNSRCLLIVGLNITLLSSSLCFFFLKHR
ncbi:hypothetical protein QBC43DRAFT_133193 [Cladorrhinum sp. PSN259]|nr:hypothetical protein QBC43DRAFT_133193 [Cladorrhinum sp. PSN259]